jgi:ATP-dependent helicase IRC3
MFMSLIPRIKGSGDRNRTLILVGSVELANQAELAAKKLLGGGWKVEVEQGKKVSTGHADV